jgi:hypothetical protein
MSYYENNPAQIRRHLDITGQVDQLHAESKAQEAAQDAARRQAWAAQQRSTFLRQRQEVAMRYEMLNIPLRPSQAWVLSVDPASPPSAATTAGTTSCTQATAAPCVPLPQATFISVFDKMANEAATGPARRAAVRRQAQSARVRSTTRAHVEAEVAELDAWQDLHLAQLQQRASSRPNTAA